MNEVQKEVARLRALCDHLRSLCPPHPRGGIVIDSPEYRHYSLMYTRWDKLRKSHDETFPENASLRVARPRLRSVRVVLRKECPALKGKRCFIGTYAKTTGRQNLRFEMTGYSPEQLTVVENVISSLNLPHVVKVYRAGSMPNGTGYYLAVQIQAIDPCLICAHLSGGHYVYDGSCGHSKEEIACYSDRLKESGELPM